MERITQNPGFHHIAENIFIYLDHVTLLKCQKVNKFWEAILQNNPSFWLWKCVVEWAKHDPNLPNIYNLPGLSKNHHEKWTKLIQKLKNPELKQNVTSLLMKIHKEGVPNRGKYFSKKTETIPKNLKTILNFNKKNFG